MSAVKTEGRRIDDVVRWEVDGAAHNYCRKYVLIDKDVAPSVGSPLALNESTGAILVANGSESGADAICLEASTTQDADYRLLALVRGPAIVNADQLVRETGVEIAELVAPFAALGILLRREPGIQGTMAGHGSA